MLKAFADDMVDFDLPIDITFDDTPSESNGQDKSYYQPNSPAM